MSGVSTQGVGTGAWANAGVVSAPSAAAIKRVFVENLVIVHSPRQPIVDPVLNKSRTPLPRQYDETVRRSARPEEFVISRVSLRDYVPVPV
jgi:hypothetical protein